MNSAGEKERRPIENQQEFNLEQPQAKPTFCESFKKYVREYCECSSIQGLNYMIRDISIFERLWWILIFLLCLGGCAYMIFEIWDKWESSPVLVSFATKDRHIYEIPFPAVTICPETKISEICLNYTSAKIDVENGKNLTEPDNQYYDYMSTICSSEYHKDQQGEYEYFDIKLYSFFDNCQSVTLGMYSLCSWMGKDKECNNFLKPIITDEGLCFSFNMFDSRDLYNNRTFIHEFEEPGEYHKPNWDPEEGYPEDIEANTSYPRRAYLAGAKNSFVAVLFTPKDDITYACADFANQGFRVSLHMPTRIPRPSQVYFNVPLDRFVGAAIMPTMLTTSSTVKSYTPEKRSCYFAKERTLKYFKIYSQANCNLECFTNYTLNQCGCVQYFMPHENTEKICGVTHKSCTDDAALTYPKTVVHQRKSNTGNKQVICDCLPVCSDLNYNVELSTTVWDWEKELPASGIPNIKNYHISGVRIFFKNDYFIPMERSELYGVSDFISNFGGLLGLFTGFSLFSIAEIVYFLSIRIIENYRHHGYWAGETQN